MLEQDFSSSSIRRRLWCRASVKHVKMDHLSFLVVLTWIQLCSPALGKPLLTEKVTRDVYQGEEHSNITLTWSHSVNTMTDSLYIDLISMEPLRSIYMYDSRFQPEPYIDDQFRGRLQCDLQLVRNGCIQCVLIDLRLSDNGRYQLEINVDGKDDLKTCQLIVRAFVPPSSSGSPANCGAVEFYVFGLFLALMWNLSSIM